MNQASNFLEKYTPPQHLLDGFHCPHSRCGVYSKQIWYKSAIYYSSAGYNGISRNISRYHYAECDRCHDISIWLDKNLIYPLKIDAPLPHKDMPKEVLSDFNEAREIFSSSPRGSAALLRLVTEKIVHILVEKTGVKPNNSDLNKNIMILVKDGLPATIQKAMDSLRIIGNEAVHPGLLDLLDDKVTTIKLFRLLNVIVENRISQVEEIEKLYSEKIPDSKKDAIKNRDSVEEIP